MWAWNPRSDDFATASTYIEIARPTPRDTSVDLRFSGPWGAADLVKGGKKTLRSRLLHPAFFVFFAAYRALTREEKHSQYQRRVSAPGELLRSVLKGGGRDVGNGG